MKDLIAEKVAIELMDDIKGTKGHRLRFNLIQLALKRYYHERSRREAAQEQLRKDTKVNMSADQIIKSFQDQINGR